MPAYRKIMLRTKCAYALHATILIAHSPGSYCDTFLPQFPSKPEARMLASNFRKAVVAQHEQPRCTAHLKLRSSLRVAPMH
jgi:hypothetical protein